MEIYLQGLMGGFLIGIAVTLMLLFSGRVTGVSGILNGILVYKKGDYAWRFFFVFGLILGGFLLKFGFKFNSFEVVEVSFLKTILAGLLVGFGTILGNGCTSGHGVCGISRLSLRSLFATITFILAGILTVRILGV